MIDHAVLELVDGKLQPVYYMAAEPEEADLAEAFAEIERRLKADADGVKS